MSWREALGEDKNVINSTDTITVGYTRLFFA
jgi:hypothetical protein